jgi:hypothetical protein
MMNPRRTIPVAAPGAAKLWPKVLSVFAASFLVFFLLFVGWDILTSIGQSSVAEMNAGNQQPIVIDPKIADELSKVLAIDQTSNPSDVNDPFFDRARLSGGAAGTSVTATNAVSSTGGQSKPPTTTVISGGTNGIGGPPIAVQSPIEATRVRYNEWLTRLSAYGDLPLDPRVFAVDDLLPVGIVDGGNGGQEIMFYSEAAGRTVSFGIGTTFFDGRLTELRPEGVVFTSIDGHQQLRMRSWARSLKTSG